MANEFIRKEYVGNAAAAKLTSAVTGASTTLLVDDATNWPTGVTAPFVVALDAGTTSEEKVLVLSRAGLNMSVLQRGYDGTTAQSHPIDARVSHVLDAYTIDQVNRMANLLNAVGTLLTFNGTNIIGTPAPVFPADQGKVLTATPLDASGLKFLPPSPVGTVVVANRAARNALAVAAGTPVYELDSHMVFVWNGTAWAGIRSARQSVAGTAITTAGTVETYTTTLVFPDQGCAGVLTVWGSIHFSGTNTSDVYAVYLRDGGTIIGQCQVTTANYPGATTALLIGSTAMAAGAKTLVMSIQRISGSGTATTVADGTIHQIQAMFTPNP